ncbi:MAG: HNH endonuclease signature motif containing protein, partial [Ilumatobacteraceae bacterium]
RCQHPSGCDTPVTDCDVDHIVPHGAGGKTTQFNGRLECRPHNRDTTKHDHGATPHPERPVTVLDEIRARLRWQHQHNDNADDGDDGDDGDEPDEPAA